MRMRLSGGPEVAKEAQIGTTAIEETAAAADTANKKVSKSTAGVRRSLTSQISAMRSVGTTMTKYLTVPILGVAAVSGKFALDFDRNMRNVNSIAQLPEHQFLRLKQSVLGLAGPTAQAPNTLAEGMYDLVSSGFNAAESITILRKSALAASAGLTTTEISTKAVAAALNAYHLPAKKAGAVSDTLFETVNRGVLTFDELSTTIGDALPFAAQLGVNLNEVGSAISTMTKQGLSSAEAVTRLKNVFVAFLKPSKGMEGVLKQIGMSGEQLLQKRGFQGAMEALRAHTDGTNEAVAKLFPNIRGMGGVLALTGKSAKSAGEDLKAFQNTTGATAKVLHEQEKSFGFQMQRAWASLQAVLIEIGSEVLPIVIPPFLSLVGVVRNGIKWFAALPNPIKQVGGELAVLTALAGPVLFLASTVLTLAKNLGILRAVEGGGAMLNKGRLGRLGAGALGIGAIAGGQAAGGKAGEAIGNIGGGAALGFSVGGPWGAAAGGAIGAALTFGPALMDLFATEKQVNPMQERLAEGAKGMASAFKAARIAVHNLNASEAAVASAQKRHHAAAQAVTRAQHALNAARRQSGPNSQAAIHAEVRYSQAIRGVTAARKAQRQAERQHGVELEVTKEKLRFATLEERHRINVLGQARKAIERKRSAMQAEGAGLRELQPINERLGKVIEQQRKAQQAMAQTVLEAGHAAGPKFAGLLRQGSRASVEYGSKIKATRHELQTMIANLAELQRAIRNTSNAFEAGVLGQRGNVLREGIERAESELPHHHGGNHSPQPHGPRKPLGGEAKGAGAAGRLMRSGRRSGPLVRQPVQFVVDKRVLAEGVVEVQEDEDATR